MPLLFAIAFAVQIGVLQDSGLNLDALRRSAREAEAAYELQRRRLAPYTMNLSSTRCDERVGRFCLRFDDDDAPEVIQSEDPRIEVARERAIEALERAARYAPHDFRTVGGLVRLLIEAGRAEEAVTAAHRFTAPEAESAWAHLLVGLALQAAGWTLAAERELDRGLRAMAPASRDSVLDVAPLLAGDEWRRYRDLDAAGRREYEEDLWRLADPLFLLAGNERRAEHIARYAWSRLLAQAPRGPSEPAWGSDLTELTLRYGVPVSHEREAGTVGGTHGLIERYDTAQRSLIPEALRTRGYPAAPPPGRPSPLFRREARSGFAPASLRRLLDLEPQMSRFAASGDSIVVRIDARVVLDSAASASRGTRDSLLVGLFLLSERVGGPEAKVVGRIPIEGDTTSFTLEAVVPRGAYVLSAEAVEGKSRLAWRARYRVDAELARGADVALSDAVITESYGDRPLPDDRSSETLRAHGTLTLPRGGSVGVYLECGGLRPDEAGLGRYRVRVEVDRESAPPVPVRVARWIGGLVGIGGGGRDGAALAWDGATPRPGRMPVAFDLDLSSLEPGLYRLTVTLTDHAAGASATTTRIVRVTDSPL